MISNYSSFIHPYYERMDSSFSPREIYNLIISENDNPEFFIQRDYHKGNDNLLYHSIRGFLKNLKKKGEILNPERGIYLKRG